MRYRGEVAYLRCAAYTASLTPHLAVHLSEIAVAVSSYRHSLRGWVVHILQGQPFRMHTDYITVARLCQRNGRNRFIAVRIMLQLMDAR